MRSSDKLEARMSFRTIFGILIGILFLTMGYRFVHRLHFYSEQTPVDIVLEALPPVSEPKTQNIADEFHSIYLLLGLTNGDVLKKINATDFHSPKFFDELLTGFKSGHLCVTFERGDRTRQACYEKTTKGVVINVRPGVEPTPATLAVPPATEVVQAASTTEEGAPSPPAESTPVGNMPVIGNQNQNLLDYLQSSFGDDLEL